MKNVMIAVATATISAVGTADTTDLFPAIAPDQVEGVPYVYAVESNIAMPGQGANFNVIYADIDGDFRFDYVGTDGVQVNLDTFHFTGEWDGGVNLLTENAINAINDTIDEIVRFAPEYTEQNADGSYTMLLSPSSTVAIPSSSDPRPAQVQPKALPWGVGNFTHTDGITQDVFYCDPPMCTSICADPLDLSMTFTEVRKMVKRLDDLYTERTNEGLSTYKWDLVLVVPVGTEIYNFNTAVRDRRTVAAGLLSLGDGRTDTCDAYDVVFIEILLNSNAGVGLAYKCKGNKLTFDSNGELVPGEDFSEAIDLTGAADTRPTFDYQSYQRLRYEGIGGIYVLPSMGRGFAIDRWNLKKHKMKPNFTDGNTTFDCELWEVPNSPYACQNIHPRYIRCLSSDDCTLESICD